MSEPNNRVVVPLAMETTSQEILARIGEPGQNAGIDTIMSGLGLLYGKPSSSGIPTMEIIDTVGTTTWIKPEGVTRVYVKMIGGGAGGGGSSAASSSAKLYAGGGGGGSGFYSEGIFDISLETSVDITVGNGGSTDSSGGISSFGTYLSVNGGTSGEKGTSGSVSSFGAMTRIPARKGGLGWNNGGDGGGSSGSEDSSVNGTMLTSMCISNGQNGYGANGGISTTAATKWYSSGGGGGGGLTIGSANIKAVDGAATYPGRGGIGYGAGGGGCGSNTGTAARNGGVGAPGCVIIMY